MVPGEVGLNVMLRGCGEKLSVSGAGMVGAPAKQESS